MPVIDGAACNGHVTSGCEPGLPPGTGGWPGCIGLDPAGGATYVPTNVDQALSVFALPS